MTQMKRDQERNQAAMNPYNGEAPLLDGASRQKYAIILGGGNGLRAGGEIPKQFTDLEGEMVIVRAMRAFLDADPATKLIVVINPGFLDFWEIECADSSRRVPEHTLCCGGPSRFASVKNGLMFIPDDEESLVAIHDGARPLVTPGMIARGWLSVSEHGASVPAIPVTDSLRHLTGDGRSESVERKDYVAVQTPQIFVTSAIKRAYEAEYSASFTDDASVAEAAGISVAIYEGERDNIKITNPIDFKVAEMILKSH